MEDRKRSNDLKWMGHTVLKSTLALMGKHGHCMCDECGVIETVKHVFFFLNVVNMKNSVGVFLVIKNTPVSIMDKLGKGLSDREGFKELIAF